MFKKSKLAMVVAAASLGALGTLETAQAAYVNSDGGGEVLILPYYNVNNNFSTQIGITNTTNLFKAVKIRFRESKKSQDVLDFNVYLSPFDQWTASVRLNPNTGKANLISADESCTYPAKETFKGEGIDLIDIYNNVDAPDVTEGYIEIYEMGVIADGPGPALDNPLTGGPNGLYAEDVADGVADGILTSGGNASVAVVDGIEHGSDGLPPDCDVIFRAWNNDGFTAGDLGGGVAIDDQPGTVAAPVNDPYFSRPNPGLNDGLVAPTGGIAAYEILLENVTGGAFVAEATAINGYSTVPQHYRSDDILNYLLPSLASGNILRSSMVFADGPGGGPDGEIVVNQDWPLTFYDTGALVDISPNENIQMGANPFPIAAILSATQLDNVYFVDPSIEASTDWVVTFPVRKHGIYNGGVLSADLDGNGVFCFRDADLWPTCPSAEDTYGYELKALDDVVGELVYWDAEEQFQQQAPGTPIVSPPIQPDIPEFIMPREVNVLTFVRDGDETPPVLGTPADQVLTVAIQDYTGGWARLAMPDYSYQTDESINCLVVPILPGLTVACNDLAGPIFPIPPLDGVPTMGFSAMDGLIGSGNAGETVEYLRHVDRDGI